MTVIINGTAGITFPDGTTQVDGLPTPVPVADGGTGLSSPGAAGNVLTSNGTAWTSTAPAPSAGTLQAVATGSLSNGSAVVVNSDGTVSVITGQGANYSSATVFESANTEYTGATYDSVNNKVVIAYTDQTNSSYGTAVVGTISGTTISFGTPVVYNSDNSYYSSPTFDSSNGKVVIGFTGGPTDNYGWVAIVGTVSGTSISFGSKVLVEAGFFTVGDMVFDSVNNKIVTVYRDADDGFGYAKVGTVSGTSISFGSKTSFNGGAAANSVSSTFDSSAGKVVIAYRDDLGKAVVGTVSGTSISFGSPVTFNGANNVSYLKATFASTNNKVVFIYSNSGNSNYGTAIVGTVSGTSISFGTPAVFATFSYNNPSVVFDSVNSKVVVTFRTTAAGATVGYGTLIVGNISGTSIVFGDLTYFAKTTSDYMASTFDTTSGKVVATYANQSNSGYGTAVSFSTPFSNMTTGNFIGFSNAAYTNGQTATIQTVGSIDDAQSSLTVGKAYYVIPSGTLSTQADADLPVFAGTSVSATKIIVKG